VLVCLHSSGKTTLSHILSCEVSPTAGDVRVFGHSVTQDPYSVRQLVGLCKQDDYLYPNLSAREHLQLFAGLRGVESSVLAETVSNWLESVDLSLVQNHYTSSFSGGMKRRLSLALATIGGRPLIILDEPTTGYVPAPAISLLYRTCWLYYVWCCCCCFLATKTCLFLFRYCCDPLTTAIQNGSCESSVCLETY
jgi:ABC-type transporter Mla maintaining outer membrane lipid asymmetry ATPase subunit MlaF